jgi:DNA-binding response OmpR family regulator
VRDRCRRAIDKEQHEEEQDAQDNRNHSRNHIRTHCFAGCIPTPLAQPRVNRRGATEARPGLPSGSVRIAALWALPSESIDAIGAFEARAVLVDRFPEPDALLLAWEERGFDAILVQDDGALLRHWLDALQTRVVSRTPIVVVGIGDASSIAQALMWGADDYATAAEGQAGLFRRVLARVRAREQAQVPPPLRVGVYSLHTMQRILASPAQQVRLTSRECNLAQVLFEHRGRLATADMLSAAIFENTGDRDGRSVERHVYKLRKKCALISEQQATPLSIESVYASGYRLTG